MVICGIIAEYNMIHKGHRYQLQLAREQADGVVVVMSGPFVQRGEIAVCDKWTRAEAAVLCGADLVIELPAAYALNHAGRFSYGAVTLLEQTGVVDRLMFGSECGEVSLLREAAACLEGEQEETGRKVKRLTESGMSYPAARALAYRGKIPDGILSKPNNILGVEYIRALIRRKSKILPVTIKRRGAGYHDTDVEAEFISASALRTLLYQGKEIREYIPEEVWPLYAEKKEEIPYRQDALDNGILDFLRNAEYEQLMLVNEIDNGIARRILSCAKQAVTAQQLADMVKVKRYTHARIKRCILGAYLGLTKELAGLEPSYLRVLAMNQTGRGILKEMKKKAKLPVIIKAADFAGNALFRFDMRACDTAFLCNPVRERRTGGKDLKTSPRNFQSEQHAAKLV